MGEKYRDLKIPESMFEAFQAVKKKLKERHGKSFSNEDTMRFLLYFAKIALEMDIHPKMSHITEPIKFELLEELEEHSQAFARELGIPVEYVRGGVLLGLLELAEENVTKDWKVAREYLGYAREWARKYPLEKDENKLSGIMIRIIRGIGYAYAGRRNPKKRDIQEKNLLEEVQNLLVVLFSRTPPKILAEVVKVAVRSRNYELALNLTKRMIREYDGSWSVEKKALKEALSEIIKDLRDAEDFENKLRQLFNSAKTIDLKLFLLQNVANEIDTTGHYKQLLRRAKLPYARIEIARSMIRSASKSNNRALLDFALSVIRDELYKLRRTNSPDLKYHRRIIAEELVINGFEDRILELKFSDEVPSFGYYLLLVKAKLRQDFEAGWKEFERLLREFSVLCSDKGHAEIVLHDDIFMPKHWLADGLCVECSQALSDVQLPLITVTFEGIFGQTIEINALCVEIKSGEYSTSLRLFTSELSNLPKFLERLIAIGAEVHQKDIAAYLLLENEGDKELALALLKEMKPEFVILEALLVLALVKRTGLEDVMSFAEFMMERLIQKTEYRGPYHPDIFRLCKTIVSAVALQKSPDEALKLIRSGKVADVVWNVFSEYYDGKDMEKLEALCREVERYEEDLIDAIVEALIEYNPRSAAEWVTSKGIASKHILQLVKRLLEIRDFKKADKLVNASGIGWLGSEDLVPLIEYRVERCIKALKQGKKNPECVYDVLSLTSCALKVSRSRDFQKIIGYNIGRLIVHNLKAIKDK